MSLHVNNLVGFGAGGGGGPTILQIIQNRSLTSGLQLCLDAGDAASYTSGQSWLDRSGNGYDFFLGPTSGVEADDPTFSGNPGDGSANEYFLYAASDKHTYDSAVETWMSALHQDNAVFSWIVGAYVPASSQTSVFSTVSAANFSGVTAVINTTSSFCRMNVRHASGNAVVLTATGTPTADAWNFFGGSLNEASASSGILKANGTTDTGVTVTYTTPSAAAANPMMLASSRATGVSANVRIAFVAIWNTALTSTDLDNLYSDIKTARAYGF